ncbi:hypothetical protein HBH53_040780 [Parastagonospora nodorum]|nr:hypothetical protein HBH53_040780 [Parastagonospora nodorum]KAH4000417.1 hypothetical protein HBI10_103690 [Parastagonospora nodorum]KAH4276191.1 hypothetical protein HBI04_119030 [Parastagonospora nodorum]KAH4373355.1 hypothetical protein HBH97_132250 [Parastagonospora nodorum]KAH4796818.1 hypothetical protein HBH63_081390 [Parastagonospora nodorum]
MERRAVLTTRHMPYDRSKPARLSICTAETNWQRYRAIQRTAEPPSPRAPIKLRMSRPVIQPNPYTVDARKSERRTDAKKNVIQVYKCHISIAVAKTRDQRH